MELQSVVSSNLSKVGYDKKSSTLIIAFKTGSIYEFQDVPEEYYINLLKSPSIGNFFSTNIRKKFKFKKIS